MQNATLKGFKDHIQRIPDFGWKVVLAVQSDQRITRMDENVNLGDLVADVAWAFGVCGRLDAGQKMIFFLPQNDCR